MNPPSSNKEYQFFQQNRPYDWFESVYTRAKENGQLIGWMQLAPSPDVLAWLDQRQVDGRGQTALVIGCGLGDDAEELARRGFAVTAFDVSATAIEWCKERFPNSIVNDQVADLFAPPQSWHSHFDFVLEYFTIQSLPPYMHAKTIEAVARLVAPTGIILVICIGRPAGVEIGGGPPWPMPKETLDAFKTCGLTEVNFEEYDYRQDSPVRKFRIEYKAG